MKIFNKDYLEEFVKKHADSKTALNRWIQVIEEAN